jgi:DNA polymerase-3 subunit delta'
MIRFSNLIMPFRDVIAKRGHRRLIDLLTRSAAAGLLPPSLIFAGPSGIGKRDTAIALAQMLNCASSAGGDACGACAVCSRIARGVHPDVLIVAPGDSGSIKIEQVRDLIDRAAYRPFEGRRRVVIIDEADALMAAAQNALLKTLEEPPPSSMFVLVTSRPDALLGTLRSRCIQLRFSEGAVYTVSAEAREVAERVLMHAATAPDPRRRIEAAQVLVPKAGSSGATDRETLSTHLLAMSSLVRDAALIASTADTATLANPDARPALDRLARVFHGERAVQAFSAVDRALLALDRNASVKIVADWLLLEL